MTGSQSAITRGQWFFTQARRRPGRMVALALVVGVALLGWRLTRPGALFGPQDGTWHRIQVNKDLYVGLDPSYPPFAEWTPEGIVGIEADLAREIGRRFGAETQILIMGYDGLYDALYTGTVDMIISGLQADSSLTDWVRYSSPYFDAGFVLVSPAAAPVDTLGDLEGGVLAVEMASAGDIAAQRWARRLHTLTIQRFMLPQEALAAAQEGQVDAALVDTISARQYLREHPGLVMAAKTTVPQRYVIATRKADFQLNHELELALRAIKNDGTLETIIRRWLG